MQLAINDIFSSRQTDRLYCSSCPVHVMLDRSVVSVVTSVKPFDNCSGGQQSQSCGCSSSVSSFSVSLRRPEQLQQLQQYLPAPLLLPNSFNVGLYSAITGRFAPSSVRPLDVSLPGRIQRFLLIQLKPNYHSLEVNYSCHSMHRSAKLNVSKNRVPSQNGNKLKR